MRPLVFDTMGTTVSFTGTPVRGIRRIFEEADARFSLYRHASEGSRVASGELALTDTSDDFREVYAIANDWRLATDGAFTAHRPDGAIDLSGVVKAWTMARVDALLEAQGVERWCLNVGGDVSTHGAGWSVGIVDPGDRGRLLAAASVDPMRPAVATSGSTERGDHIWRVGDPTRLRFVQVTVAAPQIVMADVLATAIVAGGPDGLDAFTANWPIDVLAVLETGELFATPGMRTAIGAFRAAA